MQLVFDMIVQHIDIYAYIHVHLHIRTSIILFM